MIKIFGGLPLPTKLNSYTSVPVGGVFSAQVLKVVTHHHRNLRMTKEEIFKSKAFKILLPVIALVIAVAIWSNGYQFGQWLNKVLI